MWTLRQPLPREPAAQGARRRHDPGSPGGAPGSTSTSPAEGRREGPGTSESASRLGMRSGGGPRGDAAEAWTLEAPPEGGREKVESWEPA